MVLLLHSNLILKSSLIYGFSKRFNDKSKVAYFFRGPPVYRHIPCVPQGVQSVYRAHTIYSAILLRVSNRTLLGCPYISFISSILPCGPNVKCHGLSHKVTTQP